MTVIWQFCNEWGDRVQGRPVSVDFMVDAGTDVLKIYLKEGKVTLDKPPGKFVTELKTLFGIPDDSLGCLFDILIKEDTSDVERDLTREGLLTGETDAPGDAIPDGVVVSITRPAASRRENRATTNMPATKEARDEQPDSDLLTFADFFGTDKSRYRYGDDSDDGDYDDDKGASTSATGESSADRYENLIRQGLRKVAKSRRSRGRADVPRPMNVLYDVPGAEESLFIAELWVGSTISLFPWAWLMAGHIKHRFTTSSPKRSRTTISQRNTGQARCGAGQAISRSKAGPTPRSRASPLSTRAGGSKSFWTVGDTVASIPSEPAPGSTSRLRLPRRDTKRLSRCRRRKLPW